MENKNFCQMIVPVLRKMYLCEQTADVHFICASTDGQSDEHVPAHKLLLSTASEGFKSLFDQAEPDQIVFDMAKTPAYAFREFLQFFYMPKVRLTTENIATVMELAKNYGNDDFLFLCGIFLEHRITIENVIWGYNMAVRLRRSKMKDFCEKKIGENAGDVLKSAKFLECERQTLQQILHIDAMKCGEFDVLTALMNWVKAAAQRKGFVGNDTQVLRHEMGDLLYLIRFRSISMADFSKFIQSYAGFFSADEFEQIIQMIVGKDFQSEKFNNKTRSGMRSNAAGGNGNIDRKSGGSCDSSGGGGGGGGPSNASVASVSVGVVSDGNAISTGGIMECNRFQSFTTTRYYVRPLEKTRFVVNKPGLELVGFNCGLVMSKCSPFYPYFPLNLFFYINFYSSLFCGDLFLCILL